MSQKSGMSLTLFVLIRPSLVRQPLLAKITFKRKCPSVEKLFELEYFYKFTNLPRFSNYVSPYKNYRYLIIASSKRTKTYKVVHRINREC